MKLTLNGVKALLPHHVKNLIAPLYYIAVQYRDPNLSRSMKHLHALQGEYQGNRCFIMGNGPSLNRTPLDKLEGEFVWGVNRCYLLFDRIQWRPSFYVAVDSLVVPDIVDEINLLSQECTQTALFFPIRYYLDGILKDRENIVWFREVSMEPFKNPNGYFSLNAARYVRTSNTVTITALQLAVYLGFNPIYLIGCDTDYSIPEGVEARGEAVDPGTGEWIVGYELLSATDNDPNHFDPRYFGRGSKWHAPNVRGMQFGYRVAKQVCDAQGIKVFNATTGGKLEVFPRVHYDGLF